MLQSMGLQRVGQNLATKQKVVHIKICVDGQLGCFHILTSINNAAKKMGEYIVLVTAFVFSWKITQK